MTDPVFDAVWALGLAAAVAIPVVAILSLRRLVPGLRFTSAGIGAGAGIAAAIVCAWWAYDSVVRPTDGFLWDVVPPTALMCLLVAGVAAVVGTVRGRPPSSPQHRTSRWFWLSVAAVCVLSEAAQTLQWLALLAWLVWAYSAHAD